MEPLLDELHIHNKGFTTVAEYQNQFDLIAEKLINQCVLLVNNVPHRFIEIEFYYTDALHADPFTHKDPLQKTTGEWYFHKIGAQYKGGTYKGLDLTCGSPKAHGGILIRGIQDLSSSEIKDGSCVCVDHILQICNAGSIKDLTTLKAYNPKATIGNGILTIQEGAASLPKKEIVKTARVGLNMKKKEENQTEFVMKPYRYLAYPALTKKGKIHMALALHASGKDSAQIQQLTGSPANSITNWIVWFNQGKQMQLEQFLNLNLDGETLCRALGAWHTKYGSNLEVGSRSGSADSAFNVPQFIAKLNALRIQLHSYKESEVLEALVLCRKHLSLEQAPFDEVVQAGLIPKFAEFLYRSESPMIQFEAAWALTNVASSPNFAHVTAVFEADVLPRVFKLLKDASPGEDLIQQILWLVANLLGGVPDAEDEKKVMEQRKIAIEAGLVPILVNFGQAEQLKPHAVANIAWVCDNLLSGVQHVPRSQAISLLPILAKFLHAPNAEATSYAASCVAKLTEKHDDSMVQHVLDTSGIIDSLVKLTNDDDSHTRIRSADALANLANGRPDQIEHLLSRGMLTQICQQYNKTEHIEFLYHKAVANILEHVTLAADESMLQKIIDSGVFEITGDSSLQDQDNYIWALSNATFAASDAQLQYLTSIDVHDRLIKVLSRKKEMDKELKIAVLEGLGNLFRGAPQIIPELQLRSDVKNAFRALATGEDQQVTALASQLAKLFN